MTPLPNYLKIFAEENLRFSVEGIYPIFYRIWKETTNKKKVIQQAASILKIKPTNLQKYIYKRRPIPLPLLKEVINNSLGEDEKEKIWQLIFRKFSHLSYKRCRGTHLPKELTPELAYFIGSLRDGYVRESNSTYYVGFGYLGEDREWIDKVIEPLVRTLFKEKMKIIGNLKLFGSLGVVIFLKKIFEIVPGNQQKTKIPTIIIESPLEIQKYYIAGFWDADGGCPHPKTFENKSFKPYIKFTQSWHVETCEPLVQLRQMLKRLNIHSTLLPLTKHPSRKKIAFDLTITRKNSIKNFIENIPIRHPSKSSRLGKLSEKLGFG